MAKAKKKKTAIDIFYKTIPPLAAYIDRIGAEQLNFRRFMVKEERGKYYIERTIIRINPDGSISCSSAEHAPTEEEAAAIKGALQMVKFPKSIIASTAQLNLLADKLPHAALFPIYVRGKEQGIQMVQARIEVDGDKKYVPWTLWSDGVWRAMEPDGPLPFYKPKAKQSAKIMVHEGAKAAEAAQKIAAEGKHPWAKMLAQYEHWGLLGGALAPHRADYAELHAAKPTEVIYVCDRDTPGEEVLQKFSRYYGKSLLGIVFDDCFPLSWDIADPLPEKFFSKDEETGERIYTGPDILDYVRPATWATEQVDDPENPPRKITMLTKDFASEWSHSISPEYFINRNWPMKRFIEKDFASLVRPFCHRCDIADLVRSYNAKKVETIDYRPDLPPGIYHDGNVQMLNICHPIAIKPMKGDVSILEEYFKNLIPDEADRHELMKWCATLIARPDIRMTYSVLLVSEQHGVGKTTLGEKILAPIIGRDNVSFPRERDITNSDFNGWVARKRLIVVGEIYAGHSSSAYNQLKSIVSDQSIVVNEKYTPAYTVQNWAHVMASSNSLRALKIDPEDRRWLVPKVSEDKQSSKYWIRLNNWITNQRGLEKTVWWAHEFVKKHGHVQSGVHAPESEAKREVIEAGYSRGMTFVRQLLARLEQEEGRDAIALDTDILDVLIASLYNGQAREHTERPYTIRKVAKMLGWHYGAQNGGLKDWNLPPHKARIMSLNKELVILPLRELNLRGKKPVDIRKYAQM